MRRRSDPRVALSHMQTQLPRILDSLPTATTTLLEWLEGGNLPATERLQRTLTDITDELARVRRAQRRTVMGATVVVVAGLAAVIIALT